MTGTRSRPSEAGSTSNQRVAASTTAHGIARRACGTMTAPSMPPRPDKPRTSRPVTLAIDMGGSHIKAALLGATGRLVSESLRMDTPDPLTPKKLLQTLVGVAESLDAHDRVSIGVNGLVHGGS